MENWLWILVPIAVVFALMLAVVLTTDGQAIGPFDYSIG